MAHLHDAHPGAPVVHHLIPDFFQDRLRHSGRSSGKIIRAVVVHCCIPPRIPVERPSSPSDIQYNTGWENNQQEVKKNQLTKQIFWAEKKSLIFPEAGKKSPAAGAAAVSSGAPPMPKRQPSPDFLVSMTNPVINMRTSHDKAAKFLLGNPPISAVWIKISRVLCGMTINLLVYL